MPHYVTEDDEDYPGTFFVYSTIVDNILTNPMSGARMKMWLEATRDTDRDYFKYWCVKEDVPTYGDWHKTKAGQPLPYYYWNETYGFWYVKQSDNYYTLHKSNWRD